jgi:mannan polymerase II complex MNN11 subunit
MWIAILICDLGYVNFFANTTDYAYTLNNAPRSWAMVPAVRHAMAVYPHSTYFLQLSPHALIMNPRLSLTSHIMDHKRLESLMLKDIPVVPPDSVIKTFSHLKGSDVEFVLSQDSEDLGSGSFVIKQGDWARFFLDVWYDPLYRNYNFAKAEKHALVRSSLLRLSRIDQPPICFCPKKKLTQLAQDHIVQWHPTILTKLALVPQRIFNSYGPKAPAAAVNGTYQEGDFVIHFSGCETDATRNCEQEMQPFYNTWHTTYAQKAN